MSYKSPKSKTNCWSVNVTIPERWGENENQVRDRNEYIGVVADTLEQVVDEVRRQMPDCRLIAIHHRGKVHYQP